MVILFFTVHLYRLFIHFFCADVMDIINGKMPEHYNEDVCDMRNGPTSNVVLLIVITGTKFDDTNLRNKVRSSWGVHNRTDVRVIFYLIKHAGNDFTDVITPEIQNELVKYRDIMYINDYDNQPTIRAMTCLNWINTNCSNTKFLLKIDRSAAVNMHAMMNFVYSIPDTETNIVWGRIKKKKIRTYM